MSEWISVKDRLPEKGQWVLAHFKETCVGDCHPIAAAKFFDKGWQVNPYCCCCGGLGEEVDYWMPLPQLPGNQ